MKWQNVSKILGGGTVGIVALFTAIFLLTGVSYTHTGDIFCDTECESYINISSTYWRFVFDDYSGTKYENETLFKKQARSRTLHVNLANIENIIHTDPPVKVDWLVPARGKGNWRLLKNGDTWERGKINKIKLIGHKELSQSVKWSFILDGKIDIDPWWAATDTNITRGFPALSTNTFSDRFEDYDYELMHSMESTTGVTIIENDEGGAPSVATSTTRQERAKSLKFVLYPKVATTNYLMFDISSTDVSDCDKCSVWIKVNDTLAYSNRPRLRFYNGTAYGGTMQHTGTPDMTDSNNVDKYVRLTWDVSAQDRDTITRFLLYQDATDHDLEMYIDHLYCYNSSDYFNTSRWTIDSDDWSLTGEWELQLADNGYGFNTTVLTINLAASGQYIYTTPTDEDFTNYELITKVGILQDYGSERGGVFVGHGTGIMLRRDRFYIHKCGGGTYQNTGWNTPLNTPREIRIINNNSFVSYYSRNVSTAPWSLLFNETCNSFFSAPWYSIRDAQCTFDQVLMREFIINTPLKTAANYTPSYIYDDSEEDDWESSTHYWFKGGSLWQTDTRNDPTDINYTKHRWIDQNNSYYVNVSVCDSSGCAWNITPTVTFACLENAGCQGSKFCNATQDCKNDLALGAACDVSYINNELENNGACLSGHCNISTNLCAPSQISLYLEGLEQDQNVELGTGVNVTASITTPDTVICVDVDHHDFGTNYSCGTNYTYFDLEIDELRTTTFNDSTTAKNLTYSAAVDTWSSKQDSADQKTEDNYWFYSNWTNPSDWDILAIEAKIGDDALINYTVNASCMGTPVRIKIYSDNTDQYSELECWDYIGLQWIEFGKAQGNFQAGGSFSGTSWQNMDDDDYGTYAMWANIASAWVYQTSGTSNYAGRIYEVAGYWGNYADTQTVHITSHQYDEPRSLQINLTGYESPNYPKDVEIRINGTTTNTIGLLFDTEQFSGDLIDDSVTVKSQTFTGHGSFLLGTIKLPKTANTTSAHLDITGLLSTDKYKVGEQDTELTGEYSCDATITNCEDGFDEDWDTYNILSATHPADHMNKKMYENISTNSYSTINLTYKFASYYTGNAAVNFGVYCWNNTGSDWTYMNYYQRESGTKTDVIPTDCSSTTKVRLKYEITTLPVNPGEQAEFRFYESRLDYWNYTWPTNTSIETGAVDGVKEWAQTGDLTTTNRTESFNGTINKYLEDCTADTDGFCYVPIYVYSESAGILRVSGLEINYTYQVNPITIPVSFVQAWLDGQTNETTIPIDIYTSTASKIEIKGLKYDHAGGNSTIAVTAHDTGYTNQITRNLTVFYSKFGKSLPYTWTDNIFFSPLKNDSKNVTPYSQTDSKAIYTVTGQAYQSPGIIFGANITPDYACINITISNTSTKTDGIIMNGSFKQIYRLDDLNDQFGIWMWLDLYGCDPAVMRVLRPNMTVDSYCVGCIDCW